MSPWLKFAWWSAMKRQEQARWPQTSLERVQRFRKKTTHFVWLPGLDGLSHIQSNTPLIGSFTLINEIVQIIATHWYITDIAFIFASTIPYLVQPNEAVFDVKYTFWRTQEGPALLRLSRSCPSVRTSLSIWLNFFLNGQYTSDPQYIYRFWTPYKMTIRGAG